MASPNVHPSQDSQRHYIRIDPPGSEYLDGRGRSQPSQEDGSA
jgi:hypothetical protein